MYKSPYSPRSHLRVYVPANPYRHCVFCLSEQYADAVIRIEYPTEPPSEMLHFKEFPVCAHCAGKMGQQVAAVVPLYRMPREGLY